MAASKTTVLPVTNHADAVALAERHLGLALVAEKKGKITMADNQLNKAVEYEAMGLRIGTPSA